MGPSANKKTDELDACLAEEHQKSSKSGPVALSRGVKSGTFSESEKFAGENCIRYSATRRKIMVSESVVSEKYTFGPKSARKGSSSLLRFGFASSLSSELFFSTRSELI